MTIESVGGKVGRLKHETEAAPIAIGEPDAQIFSCPSCARPLAVGSRRCPGCRTRLVMGIRASRALLFVVLGLVVGLAAGGGGTAFALSMSRTEVVAPPVAVPSVAPSAAPIASAPAKPPLDPAVPAAAISALRQSWLINQRLEGDAANLAAAVAASDPSSADIARSLRTIAVDASLGSGVAPGIGHWSAGTELADRMASFYGSVGTAALDGLSVSLTNTPAYVKTARQVLSLVADLKGIDASVRTLAADAGLTLAP